MNWVILLEVIVFLVVNALYLVFVVKRESERCL